MTPPIIRKVIFRKEGKKGKSGVAENESVLRGGVVKVRAGEMFINWTPASVLGCLLAALGTFTITTEETVCVVGLSGIKEMTSGPLCTSVYIAPSPPVEEPCQEN